MSENFNTSKRFLPLAPQKCEQPVDVVLISGDAYVDHPSFPAAMIGRVIEAAGFSVGIIAQPDWRSAEPWRHFGRPRLAFAIAPGAMDSMLAHYTAARKKRNSDAYTPGGEIGKRPDRASQVYSQRAREAFSGVPIILGGVEPSMRRLAHYDYWSDKVRRSILLDAKADLLVYGMGESAIVEILKRLQAGELVREITDVPGTAYWLGANAAKELVVAENDVVLPSVEEVQSDPQEFTKMTQQVFASNDPYFPQRLLQWHSRELVVVNPPAEPLSSEQLDPFYELPFQRDSHPSYGAIIPAFDVIKHSLTVVRGCAGGCNFCSIALHQGRDLQSRSEASVLQEVECLTQKRHFHGTISDLGGPSANMFAMGCLRREERRTEPCRRTSCLVPNICPHFNPSHRSLVHLMREVRVAPNVKKVLIASGIRMDLALKNGIYLRELFKHHVGGRLKIAPEHSENDVLGVMGKPSIHYFEHFSRLFHFYSQKYNRRQIVVPYFIANHPGCDLKSMVQLAEFIHDRNLRPEKVQDYIPLPMTLAASMYYTGTDPRTGKNLNVTKGEKARRIGRALLHYYKQENYIDVREALRQTGREDLIGEGANCLISSKAPPRRQKKKTRPKRSGKGGYRQKPRR